MLTTNLKYKIFPCRSNVGWIWLAGDPWKGYEIINVKNN